MELGVLTDFFDEAENLSTVSHVCLCNVAVEKLVKMMVIYAIRAVVMRTKNFQCKI